MSIGRRNWSALSSLAKQWSIEDEEEQKRERRRKLRMNNSVSDSEDNSINNGPVKNQKYTVVESPEEEEVEDPEASKSDEQNRKFIEMLKSRDDRRQKRHLEVLQNLKTDHQNDQRWQHDEEQQPESNLEQNEQQQQHRQNALKSGLERDEQQQQQRWRCDRYNVIKSDLDTEEQQRWQSDRNNVLKSSPESDELQKQQTVKDTVKLQKYKVQDMEKNKSLKGQVNLTNDSRQSQMDAATKGASYENENQSNTPVEDSPKTFSAKVYLSSLKMPTERNSDNGKENSNQGDFRNSDLEFGLEVTHKKESDVEEDLKSSALATNSGYPDPQEQLGDERSHASQMETDKAHIITSSGTSQIKESVPSPLIPEEQQTNTETDSSEQSRTPFVRSTPRGTSFRLTRKVPTEASLRRSASLRIPSSALEERLQRYTSAAQKTENMKSPLSPTKGVFLPEGVASKRNLFEKAQRDSESNSAVLKKQGAAPAHGGLSRGFKQWSIQSSETERSKGPKETVRVDVSSKRNLWEKRSNSTTSPSS